MANTDAKKPTKPHKTKTPEAWDTVVAVSVGALNDALAQASIDGIGYVITGKEHRPATTPAHVVFGCVRQFPVLVEEHEESAGG